MSALATAVIVGKTSSNVSETPCFTLHSTVKPAVNAVQTGASEALKV